MSAQHTHGQLRVTHNNWEASTLHCDGIAVARVLIESDVDEQTQQHCESVKEANARRLAACWNACDGISTEHLEDDAVRKLIQDRDPMLAQRDEMLALLRIVRGKHGCGALTLPRADVERIDAAIAKAGGAA